MPHTISRMTVLGSSVERRNARRFEVSAPAFFYWTGSDGTLRQEQGVTRNISVRGVFIVCSSSPLLRGHVELDVYLPALSGAPRSVQLHGEGTVLRVNREDSKMGFAAEVVFQTDNSDAMTVLDRKPQ